MQDASSKQQTKQKYKPNHQQTALPHHSAMPIGGKTNKQKTQPKSHPIQSLHKPLVQPLGRQKPKERIQPWSLGKGDLKHNKIQKNNEKQRNTSQMKEQTRNTEVQINEEEIGKLPEKEFRIMIVKMIENLENKMDKIQESINKDLEELKSKTYGDKQYNYWN